MKDKILVRPVKPSDFAQWKPLWLAYNAFYGRKGRKALPEEVTNITWARFFDPREPVHGLVAEQSFQILGIVHFIYHRSTTSIAPTCYLQDLFTAEPARGKGIGAAMIKQVYNFAREAGCGRVYWLTHETNETAMKLYDKLANKSGFIVYRKSF